MSGNRWLFLSRQPVLFLRAMPEYDAYQLHYIFTRQPDHGVKDLNAYYIGILSSVLGSHEAAEWAYLYHKPDGFFAYFPPHKAHLLQEHPSVIEVCPKFQPPPSDLNPDEVMLID